MTWQRGRADVAAFVLAYDAARKACAAVLAQQGLPTRSQGHHVTTEQVVDKAGAILDAAELLLPALPMFRAG